MLLLKRSEEGDYDPLFQPERIVLEKETTRIGRSADMADIVMDSKVSPRMISRMHAQISRADGQVLIHCSGMNGMLVNSVKTKKCVLQDGDEVVFGGAGTNTTDGSLVSNVQSELVYVFQAEKKSIELKDYSDESIRSCVKDSDIYSKSGLTSKTFSRVGTSNDRGDKNDTVRVVYSKRFGLIPDQCEPSPVEGTSDGSVLRHTKQHMMPVDSDDDSDANISGYTNILERNKYKSEHPSGCISEIGQVEKQLNNEEECDGIIKRKKKRNALPFDSDEDSSFTSPVKKILKTDSPTEKKEERKSKEKLLQSEISENRDFLEDLNEELLCCICRELLVLTHALHCSHTFCYPCIRDWLREAQDCPSCRAKASFNHLVPVKVLDNTVDKVASKVLSSDLLEERRMKIQELNDKINGRMGETAKLRAEYGSVKDGKEHCEKCNLPISNRLLRWVIVYPITSSTSCYHYKCFKPPKDITLNQVQIGSGMSTTDMKKIRCAIR